MSDALDAMDWRILDELQADGRLSFNELSRRVHLSAPAVGERVRRLEQMGVITGYHAHVDPALAGWPVTALVRVGCYGSSCVLRDPDVPTWPNVLEIHRVTGADCCVMTIVARTTQELEAVIDRIATYGTPSSTLILSSPLQRSAVTQPQ